MSNVQPWFDTWLATFGDRLIQQLGRIDVRLQQFDQGDLAELGSGASQSQLVNVLDLVDRAAADGGVSAGPNQQIIGSASAGKSERDLAIDYAGLDSAARDRPQSGAKSRVQVTAQMLGIGALSDLSDVYRTTASSDEHTTLLAKQNELAQKQLEELRQIKRKLGAQSPALFAPGNAV